LLGIAGVTGLQRHGRRRRAEQRGQKLTPFDVKHVFYPGSQRCAKAEAIQLTLPQASKLDCFASLAMTEKYCHTHQSSSPAQAADPVRRGPSIQSLPSLEYWIARLNRAMTAEGILAT
jgi:hypothetical protein